MARRPTTVTASVARFGAAGLLAVVALGALVLYGVSRISTAEALRSAREGARLAGYGIVEPALAPGMLDVRSAQDPVLATLDGLVQQRVLSERVVRVKIWSPDGRIVYSDEPRLIGRQYEAKADHAEVLRTGAISSEIADTDSPENRYERRSGRLLEVYLPLRTADGGQVVYEQYERYDSVAGNGRRLLRRLALPLGLGLAVLWLTQLPLARSLARRVKSAEAERLSLLERAVTASERERERIAADLHDGVVQDLAGLTFELAAAAPTLPAGPARATVERCTDIARGSMRRVRSSLVELHPQRAHALGLGAALDELAEPLRGAAVRVDLSVDPAVAELRPETASLLYRMAHELLRNVHKHAMATEVAIAVALDREGVELRVADNGRGFDAAERRGRRAAGHLGLELHEALVRQAGGRVTVSSAPAAGTTVIVQVPR